MDTAAGGRQQGVILEMSDDPTMRRAVLTILVVIGALVVLVAGAYCLDRLLAHPDRVAAAKRRDVMITVRDQVLRYQFEHGSLPRTLGELVPNYLRVDQILGDGKPIYTYDPAARVLRQTGGGPIKGLYNRLDPPLEMTLSRGDLTAAPVATTVETRELLGGGIAVLPNGRNLPEPPSGCYVFEAEHFNEMNWGWEVRADPTAAGGATIHSWEGITNSSAQLVYSVWDFYDVHSRQRDYTVLKYHFHLPKAGSYYVYGRMWTTDTHCSNNVHATIDSEEPRDNGGMGNVDPFQWLWSPMGSYPLHMTAGDHYLYIFIHEDGMRIDQFLLSPKKVYSGGPWKENLVPGKDTAWEKKEGPPVHVSFDVARQVISPETPPKINVVLRRLHGSSARATLRVTLESAGLNGSNWRVAEHAIDLARMPEVCRVPLNFTDLNLAMLDRREYLLRSEIVSDGKTIFENRVPLLRPFAWEVLGPLEYLDNNREGPFDRTREPDAKDSRHWVPLKESSMEHFGVLDFGLHTTGNTANAPLYATMYARTRVNFPATDDYLFLIQSDDEMLFWIDGKQVYRFDDHTMARPVARSATRCKIRVEAGDHELRMRVNQRFGPWQASVRIRTREDDVSNVVGLPRPTP
jgi:hypothetical protein